MTKPDVSLNINICSLRLDQKLEFKFINLFILLLQNDLHGHKKRAFSTREKQMLLNFIARFLTLI